LHTPYFAHTLAHCLEHARAWHQGGNYVDLHSMLGVSSGTEVLYVGDHIYGDILRSKKVRGARGVRARLGAFARGCEWLLLSSCVSAAGGGAPRGPP
jgi:hypothetical protein